MTPQMYSLESPKSDEKCYMCGEPAALVLRSDSSERDTGYRDEVPLCEECAKEHLD